MTDKLEDRELCDLTLVDPTVAIVECIDGLGCTVYAEGRVLPPWASNLAEELVGIHMHQGAVITSETEAQYFVMKRGETTERLKVLRGPLKADELRAAL
jgi:hypothetical protein